MRFLLTVHLFKRELRRFWNFVFDKSESFVTLRQRVPAHRDAPNRTEGEKCLKSKHC